MNRKIIRVICICLVLVSLMTLACVYISRQNFVQEIASEVNGGLTELTGTLDDMVRAYDKQDFESFEGLYWELIYQKGRMNGYCYELQSASDLDEKYPEAFSFLMELSGLETDPEFPQACYNTHSVERMNLGSSFLHDVIHKGRETLPLEKTLRNLEAKLGDIR